MHELSIVIDLLDIVEDNAKKHNALVVHEIELAVGDLAGVEFDALEFAIDNAPRSELLKNAKFIIQRVAPVARCTDCSHEFKTTNYADTCPACNSFRTELTKGNELKIISFKMD